MVRRFGLSFILEIPRKIFLDAPGINGKWVLNLKMDPKNLETKIDAGTKPLYAL